MHIRKEFALTIDGFYIETRITGCFAPIFYSNCEHVLFLWIVKNKIADLKTDNEFSKFSKFTKIKTFSTFFWFWSFINVPCGHARYHKKFGPDCIHIDVCTRDLTYVLISMFYYKCKINLCTWLCTAASVK